MILGVVPILSIKQVVKNVVLHYVGQTKRRLKDRLKEHMDIKSMVAGLGVSGVADHVLNTSHSIDWDNVTILDRESNRLVREIKESI